MLRWERQWDDPGQPFRDPASYPCVGRDVGHARHRADDDLVGECVARREEGRAGDLLGMRRLAADDRSALAECRDLPHVLREAMPETLYASGANLMILPIQDVFGWRDRINTPATVGDDNWTWRLPWASDRLFAEPGQWVSPASFASGQSGTAASDGQPRPAIRAHVSFSVTVLLKTGAPARESGSTLK